MTVKVAYVCIHSTREIETVLWVQDQPGLANEIDQLSGWTKKKLQTIFNVIFRLMHGAYNEFLFHFWGALCFL